MQDGGEVREVISAGEAHFERTRKFVGLVLGPAVFITLYLVPIGNLTPPAHRLAAILGLVIVWWITEAIPIPVTAMLGAVLAIFFDIDTAQKVFAPFADKVVFLFIGSFILAEAMSKHRLDRRIAYSILALPGVGNSTQSVLFVFGLIAAILSMWLSNTATTAMLFPIGLGILSSVSQIYEEQHKTTSNPKTFRYGTAMMLMAAYASSVGGIGTPVGTPPNLIGIGLISKLVGIKISFFQWMVFAVPMTAVMYVILYFLLVLLHRPEIGRIEGVAELIRAKKTALGRLGPGERNVLIAFLITVLLWVFPGIIAVVWGGNSAIARWYETRIPEAGAAVFGASLLFFMPTNWSKRQFTISWAEAVKIDWGTIILFGGGLSLGALMFSTGLADALGQWIFHLTGAKSLWAITATSIGLGILISEVTSNTASANMVIPVMISLARAAGVNPLPPALGACIGASYGFMLPVSTPPNAIVYGSGMVPITKMLRAGIFFDVIGFFIILFGLFLLLPLAGIR